MEIKDDFKKKVRELSEQEKFDDIIILLTDRVLEIQKDEELYIWRGNRWYDKNEYDKAIVDYGEALKISPDYALAFYNRGFSWVAKEEYDKAIEDYRKAINLDPNYASAYVIKASILRALKEYGNAIVDYDKAIDCAPDYANAYYNRGLAKKENDDDLEGSKQDFEEYLKLTADENDIWTKYAKYYIEDLDVMIKDPELRSIRRLVDDIRDQLLVHERYITHYTSLSVLQYLIFDNSKFRISEGNFMNDPSEGKELLTFLNRNPYTLNGDLLSENFSPKPFIGSFVTKDKYDDLNMWRFYGKEKGVEAKGCAITLCARGFLELISKSLPNGGEVPFEYENDINFYWVVYVGQNGTTNFYIPDSDKTKELEDLMYKLKEKVGSYKGDNKTFLEQYLNSIAFLFKSDVYKNENEIRLVINGIKFEKKYDMDIIPPRIYIELDSIKNVIEKITLGPKVDKASEWASAFYYSYEVNPPGIIISHLPYK